MPGEEGMCGLLERSLYGTRDAAYNWTETYTKVLCSDLGFVKGESSPCTFHHEKRNLKTVVHGDDFFTEGPAAELRKMDEDLKKHFEMKTEMLGPDKGAGEVQEIRFLNRVLSWHDKGISWEADPRHAEMVIKQLGLEGAQTAATPGMKEENKTMEKDSRCPEHIVDTPEADELMAFLYGRGDCDLKIEHSDRDLDMASSTRATIDSQSWPSASDESIRGSPPVAEDARRVRPAEKDEEMQGGRIEAKLRGRDMIMTDSGWTRIAGDKYMRVDMRSTRFAMPPIDGMTRRVTRVLETGRKLEDLRLPIDKVFASLGSGKPIDSRVDRILNAPASIETEMELIALGNVEDDVKPMEESLPPREASLYRAIVARVNFLAADRSELQFASKECSRRMANPRVMDWGAVKRIGRYLLGRPRSVQWFLWQDAPGHFSVYSDSDWAGCRETRKSTSGACLMHGGHLLKSYSRTQSNVALSSAEAELYATVSAASEGIGLGAMARDYGRDLRAHLHVDATAAIGIAERKGLGKIRHLDTQSLWIQDAVRKRRVSLEKVLGTENPADLMTKHLDQKTIDKLMGKMAIKVAEGRAAVAPNLNKTKSVDLIEDNVPKISRGWLQSLQSFNWADCYSEDEGLEDVHSFEPVEPETLHMNERDRTNTYSYYISNTEIPFTNVPAPELGYLPTVPAYSPPASENGHEQNVAPIEGTPQICEKAASKGSGEVFHKNEKLSVLVQGYVHGVRCFEAGIPRIQVRQIHLADGDSHFDLPASTGTRRSATTPGTTPERPRRQVRVPPRTWRGEVLGLSVVQIVVGQALMYRSGRTGIQRCVRRGSSGLIVTKAKEQNTHAHRGARAR